MGAQAGAASRPERELRPRCGRDPRHRGRERIGQIHPCPCPDRDRPRLRRAGAVGGQGPSLHGRGGAPPPSPRHPDDLPGPAGRARSPDDGGRDRRRAARRPRTGTIEGRGEEARGGDDGAGGPAARAYRPLPARVLRRPVPAHRHRPGADRAAQAGDLRRAGLGARRQRAGPDRQPAGRPQARTRPVADLHLPRSRCGEAHLGPDHGVLSRPRDGVRPRRRPRPRSPPSLHTRPDRRGAGSRSRRWNAAAAASLWRESCRRRWRRLRAACSGPAARLPASPARTRTPPYADTGTATSPPARMRAGADLRTPCSSPCTSR